MMQKLMRLFRRTSYFSYLKPKPFHILLTICISAFLPINTSAQSCPLKVGPFELSSATYNGNKFRCFNTVNTFGSTICTLDCTYGRPEIREVNSISVSFEYASTVVSAISVGTNNMCKQGTNPSGKSSLSVQVFALREYIDNPFEAIHADHVITSVFKQIEPLAVPCPGARISTPLPSSDDVCPERAGTFFRSNPNQVFGVSMDAPECRLDQAGNRVCRTSCSYRDSNAVGANQLLLTPQWTEVHRQRELPHRGMCTLAASPEYWGHPRKQAVVGYEGGTSPWIRSNAETLARQALDKIAVRAVDCPPASEPSVNCAANFENYQKAWLRSNTIEREIAALQDPDKKLSRARDDFAKWNEVIRGIADADYRGPQKALVRQLLHLNPDLRNRLRGAYGLKEDADAPTIARTMRDIEAARVDYYLNARQKLRALEEEKLDVDIKVSAARNEIRKGGCGGSLDAKSCELSGEWELFNADNSMGIWNFRASGANTYTAKNSVWDISARVEIRGRTAVLMFSDPDFAGRTVLEFETGCRTGSGDFQLQGTNRTREMTAQRLDNRQTVLVEGRLYGINFEGRFYQAEYSRQSNNGRPIDVFYFKILQRDGSQPEIVNANGVREKLAGRFVRDPSFDHSDQSNVEWYFVNWVLKDGEWKQEHRKGARFEVR